MLTRMMFASHFVTTRAISAASQVGGSTGGRAELNSIMERHNGSSEERWSKKERRQKGRTQEDSKKGRTQSRTKGREKGHEAEGHQEESHPQAPLTRSR